MPQTATMVDVRALLPNTAWPRGSGFPTIIKKILNACYRVKLLRLRGRYCRLHTFLSRPELRFYTDICRPELHFPPPLVLLVIHKSASDLFSLQAKHHTLRTTEGQGSKAHPNVCRL